MQCSEHESLAVFNGRVEAVSASVSRDYSFSPYIFRLRTDSITWVFNIPPGGSSSASVIASGHIQTDSVISINPEGQPNTVDIGLGENHIELSIETHTDSVPGIVHFTLDSAGNFIDTVLIAASPFSGFILPQNSRLVVNKDDSVIDTILIQSTRGQ